MTEDEKIKVLQEALESVPLDPVIDSGPYGSGYSLCRGCLTHDDNHKTDCWVQKVRRALGTRNYMTNFKRELEEIQNNFRLQMEELAKKVRKELVLPVCKKHRLTYLAGNGTFAFYKGEETLSCVDAGLNTPEGKLIKRFGLGPILDVLDLKVQRNDVIGFYVLDVRKEDW